MSGAKDYKQQQTQGHSRLMGGIHADRNVLLSEFEELFNDYYVAPPTSTWNQTLLAGNLSAGVSPVISDGDVINLGGGLNGSLLWNGTYTIVKDNTTGDGLYIDATGGVKLNGTVNVGLNTATNDILVQEGFGVVLEANSGAAKLRLNQLTNEISVTTSGNIKLDGATYTYTQLSASTLPWLNGSKQLKSSSIVADGNGLSFLSGYGIDTTFTGGTDTLNIGITNADVINIGTGSNPKIINVGSLSTLLDQINIYGSVNNQHVTNLNVDDKLITLNKGGASASAFNSGIELEEGAVITGYIYTSLSRDAYQFKAPSVASYLEINLASLTGNKVLTAPDVNGIIATLNGGQTFTNAVWNGTAISDTYISSSSTWNAKVGSVTGTANRITIGGTSTAPTIDISSAYIGQNTIITLGTVSTGVWNGTAIADGYISSATNWNTAYTNRITSLTVTGSSGASTLVSNTLNIPTYTLAGLGGTTLAAVNAQTLAVFAATTSAQLRGVLSDENGTGVALFDSCTSATFITPILGTPASGNLANCTFPTLNQNTSGTAAGLSIVLVPASGGTGIANNNASTWTISGNFATTVTVTATTGITLPTSGTLYGTKAGSITSAQMLASMSDPTGTGASVFGTSPTFTTQIITPAIYGGSGVNGTLLIDATSNGSKGGITYGTASASNTHYFNAASGTNLISFIPRVSNTTQPAIYLSVAAGSETANNYFLAWDGSLRINAQTTTSTINFCVGNTGVFAIAPGSSVGTSFFSFVPRARTALTTLTNVPVWDFGSGNSVQTWAAGTVPLQYFSWFRSQTMAFASASTATFVSTVTVDYTTRGTNATFGTSVAMYIPTLAYTTTTTAIGLLIEAATGATNNYHAKFTSAGLGVWIDDVNIVLSATTGTKVGTATSQKLGFWNATPIVQPSSANQAAMTNSTTGTYDGTLVDVGAIFSQAAINNNFTDLYTVVNEMRNVLVNTGLMKGSA